MFTFLVVARAGGQVELDALIDAKIDGLLSTYEYLHAHPELSFQEKETSAFVAGKLRDLGYEVKEGIGEYEKPGLVCYGLVGIMKNGDGPSVLLRTDFDALPMEEKTGLPYASKRRSLKDGKEVPVMHACGHDIHMSCFLGAAMLLSRLKEHWHGTLMLVGQPAEETGSGSRALLKDNLYGRFGRPDFGVALHDHAGLEAGKLGWCSGHALASVDSVDIRILGAGGHGAYPHKAKDPVVTAARVILALQTVVSREISPLDPAVVTVGSIHGGSRHNIIPEEVELELTVRTYQSEVRRQVLEAIERIVTNIVRSAGIPEERAPVIHVREDEHTPSVYNDPKLMERLVKVWQKTLGKENVIPVDPVMAGEDFARYSLEDHSIPCCLFWLGAVDPDAMEASKKSGKALPPLHSPHFAPLPEPTIRTGVKALSSAVLDLMGK